MVNDSVLDSIIRFDSIQAIRIQLDSPRHTRALLTATGHVVDVLYTVQMSKSAVSVTSWAF
jgi:hypothetical protein